MIFPFASFLNTITSSLDSSELELPELSSDSPEDDSDSSELLDTWLAFLADAISIAIVPFL